MKLFITCLVFAVASVQYTIAGSGKPPKVIFPKTFTTALKENKSFFEGSSAKACACQVLRVSSNNEEEKLIAVFAQTSVGGKSFNYAPAMNVLDKEKKHLKSFFFTSIKTTENITAPVECNMMYKSIQLKYKDVKFYDILDADALGSKQVAGK